MIKDSINNYIVTIYLLLLEFIHYFKYLLNKKIKEEQNQLNSCSLNELTNQHGFPARSRTRLP